MINLITSQRDEVFSKTMKNAPLAGLHFQSSKLFKISNDFNKEKDYHWTNNKKLKKDIKKIFSIYGKFLKILSLKLNSLHGEKFPKRYWEILIWVWLFRFIIYYYDRWETIKYLNKKFNKKKVFFRYTNFEEKCFIPRDTEDWCTASVMTDDWNHWVYSKILEKNSNVKKILIDQLRRKPKKIFDFQKSRKKKKILQKILNTISKFTRNKDIFYPNVDLSNKFPFKIKLFFKTMGTVDREIFWDFSQKANMKERNFLSKVEKPLRSTFEKFLISQLKFNFPTIFLENYKHAKKIIDKKSLPIRPKLVITSVADMFNEPFKFYSAKKSISGSKLFHLQHGGSYGSSDDYPVEKIQVKLFDKFFSWGWSNNNKKIIPNFCQKTFGIKIKQTNETKGLLIPIIDLSLYPGNIGSGRPRTIYDLDNYINILKTFFSNLKEEIKGESAFKYLDLNKIYPKYVLKSLKSEFKKTIFFSSHKPGSFFLEKYKLNIETFNSTGCLESLNLNLPTLLIFDKNYCRIRKESFKYFKLLQDAKILFYNPTEAAKFVNSNYNNIDKWWYSRKVQNAVKIFTNKFAKTTNNPYKFLKKLKKYI